MNWGQPEGKSPLVALEQGGDDALHGSDGAAMDHDDALEGSVSLDVGQIEPFRLVEVDLDGGDGFLVAAAITDLKVELRTVERGLPRRIDQLEVGVVEYVEGGRPKRLLVAGPVRSGAEPGVGVVPQRQADVVNGQAEDALGLQCRAQCRRNLLADLVGSTEDVGVVEADLANALQAGDDARPLRPEHRREFVEPDRQITI